MVETFRRPLGLALSGGGALGAWQCAALGVLEKEYGLAFDSVLGFSAGALTGSAYFLGAMDEALARWKSLDGRILRFSPRLWPPSLFSDSPIWESIGFAMDDARAKENARCRFVAVSAGAGRDKPVYAVYTPGGREGWDAPLAANVAASCSIPVIFPRQRLVYRGRSLSLIDGGIPCAEPLSFRELGACRDVLVLEMVRPEEPGRPAKGLLNRYDQAGREMLRRDMDDGVASLKSLAEPPRIFRLPPSRVLALRMLDFSAAPLREAMALGEADARSFMSRPGEFLVGG
jgi:predicted acylesterase/phospholipase RssA